LNGAKVRSFRDVFAPEGLQDSAEGFNPGSLKINEFALKGREATDESRTYRCAKIKWAIETCNNSILLSRC
jgi:hypothetical protein